jgi:hypothetical protein
VALLTGLPREASSGRLFCVRAEKGNPEIRVISAQGIAADDVAEIRVLAHGNELLRSVPVIDNVYTVKAAELPASAGPIALEAVDQNGNVSFRSGSDNGQRP